MMVEDSRTRWLDAEFRKSSYSGGQNGSCVEISRLGVLFGVRNSKNGSGPVLAVSNACGRAFLTVVKADRLNQP